MLDPSFLLRRLEPLRQRIIAGSNEHCFIERQELLLQAARARPQEHRDLCVRVTGFSEYFVALSPEGQQDIIDRTVY